MSWLFGVEFKMTPQRIKMNDGEAVWHLKAQRRVQEHTEMIHGPRALPSRPCSTSKPVYSRLNAVLYVVPCAEHFTL